MARDEMGKEIVEEQSDDDIPSTRSSALVPEVLTYYLIIVFCFRNLKWSDSQPPPRSRHHKVLSIMCDPDKVLCHQFSPTLFCTMSGLVGAHPWLPQP
jgi:hypothetical protein